MCSGEREVADNVPHPFGWQAEALLGRMTALAARLAPAGLFDDRLGSRRRVSTRRQRGVGGVGAEAGLEIADECLQFGDAAFQRRDARVAFPTFGTTRPCDTVSI